MRVTQYIEKEKKKKAEDYSDVHVNDCSFIIPGRKMGSPYSRYYLWTYEIQ